MKLHKYTVYVLYFERYGVDDHATMIDNAVDHATVIYSGTAEIGDWEDDHPINTGERSHESYFKESV